MTAVNVIVQTDRVHLVTDGAAIDATGKICTLRNKVAVHPHLSAAVAVNGTNVLHNIVAAVTAEGSTYAEMRSTIVHRLREAMLPIRDAFVRTFGPHVLTGTVAVAGWGERGPEAYLIATGEFTPLLPPWTVVDVPGMYYTPSDSTIESDFADLNVRFDDAAAIDLVSRQRTIIAPSLGNWSAPIVGGFCQLSTVRRHAIETRILKNWKAA